MNTISEFISNKNSFRHHALLFISHYFSTNLFPENDFKDLVQEFCGVTLSENKEETVYQVAARHPDIFIADRERKILRLEDIKQIRNFSLYPPQQALKRLFFIDNCERLNANAANSLLKVIEEPSTSCLFILTSCKISFVLPTITSRVQKIALTFPQTNNTDIREKFSAEDRLWIQSKIEQFSIDPAVSQQDDKSPHCAEIMKHCEKLAKEYQVEDLRALLVTLVNEKLKQDYRFINTAKLFLSNMSEWKNVENYHPSTALWLVRLFLLF